MSGLETAALAAGIPERMVGGIARYIERGIRPGSFLAAVISNDLAGAVMYADDENALLLCEYVQFFYESAPSRCWGSVERMQAWMLEKLSTGDRQ